jgi:hypothetical protein
MADRILVFAPNPGRIRAEIPVRAPRLNDRTYLASRELVEHPSRGTTRGPTVHPSRPRPSPPWQTREKSYLGSALRRPAHTVSLPLDGSFVCA